MVSDLETRARERVLKRYGPQVLERLPFWKREALVLMEEVKLENEEATQEFMTRMFRNRKRGSLRGMSPPIGG